MKHLHGPDPYRQPREYALMLERENARLRAEKAEQEREWAELCAERERPLKAENERLRAALDDALGTLEAIELLDLGRNEKQRKMITDTCDRIKRALEQARKG